MKNSNLNFFNNESMDFSKEKRHMPKIFTNAMLGFSFLLLLSGNTFAQKKEKFLVGKVFSVEFTELGKKKTTPAKDEILFRADHINSTFMLSENNFTASVYTTTVDSTSKPSVISFQSDSKNKDEDKLKWEGTVTGDAIKGTAVITDKKGKSKKEYEFSGTLKSYKK